MQTNFRKLIAWQKAMALANRVYDLAAALPTSERYVLSEQMRDAALSIPSNIAEGQGRWTAPEYRRFLRDARGSTFELQSQILFAQERQFIDSRSADEIIRDAEEVGRLINGLIRYLNTRTK